MIEWSVHNNKRQAIGESDNGVFRVEPKNTGTLQVAYQSNKLKRWDVVATAATMNEAQRIAEGLAQVEHY